MDQARTDRRSRFVAYLARLGESEDRGSLAVLRRSLGQRPGMIAEASAIVEPFLLPGSSTEEVRTFYLVAGLFALHPVVTDARWSNLGTSLRAIRQRGETTEEDPGVARRFTAVLDARDDAVGVHLRNLVTLLHARSEPTPINFVQLLQDLRRWDDTDRHVQRQWAAGFWGHRGDDLANGPRESDTTANHGGNKVGDTNVA